MVDDDEVNDQGNGDFAAHGIHTKLSWALRSETGKVRATNEDYADALVPPIPDDAWTRPPVFVLADGMGGHEAGEVASRLAVEATLEAWEARASSSATQAVRGAVRLAAARVFEGAAEVSRRGMGTTLVVMTLSGHEAVVANVGDSRCYHVRGDRCTQLTVDHSRVAEMVRMRMLTPEQAATHPARSQLTRVVGGDPLVPVDVFRADVTRGDVLVLCSDGLWDLVGRSELAETCARLGTPEVPTPRELVDDLVAAALSRGAPDNVSVVVVAVTSDLPVPGGQRRRSFLRRGRA